MVRTTRLPMMTVTLLVALAATGTMMAGCGGGGGDDPGVNVSGTVRDDSSLQPIQGATVQVAGSQPVTTDANGFFTVADISAGSRQMSIYGTGYQTLTSTFQVSVGGTNLGDVYLPVVASSGKGHISGLLLETFDAVSGQLDDPVDGATIVAGGRTAVSKTDGSFSIYNITPGPASVVAQSGTKLARGNVTVPADGTTSVTLRLSVSPPAAPAL